MKDFLWRYNGKIRDAVYIFIYGTAFHGNLRSLFRGHFVRGAAGVRQSFVLCSNYWGMDVRGSPDLVELSKLLMQTAYIFIAQLPSFGNPQFD